MTHGFSGFLLLVVGNGGCGEGAGCMAGDNPGFIFSFLCVQIIINIKMLNSRKSERTL